MRQHNAENPSRCYLGCPVCKKEGLAGASKSWLVNAFWKKRKKMGLENVPLREKP